MRRVLSHVLAVLVVVVGLVAVSGAPAVATHGGVLVGLGPTGPFADQLPHSLFQGSGRLVPGDVVERTLYVRNDSDIDTHATVQVLAGGDAGFGDALELRVGRGAAAARVDLDSASSYEPLGRPVLLHPGQVHALDLALVFDREVEALQGMSEQVTIDLLVSLTETASASAHDHGDHAGDGGVDHGGDGGAGCEERVAVPLVGPGGSPGAGVPPSERPACVPYAVDSGSTDPGLVGGLPLREPAAVTSTALLALLAGAMLGLATARRRDRGSGAIPLVARRG